MQGKHWIRRITDGADLPGAELPGQPLVELLGDTRVLIECHRGVRAYSPEEILVGAKSGGIRIHGTGLELMRMSEEQLVISGQIRSVTLLGREDGWG